MAYVKLAPLAVFFLATFVMSPMKNVEAVDCSGICWPFVLVPPPCGSSNCSCIPWAYIWGTCANSSGSERVIKMVGEHPNLCESHADCMKKESGSFCGRYPNPDIQYGWCFPSETEAERYFKIGSNSAVKDFFKIGSNSEAKGFLKMAAEIAI